MSSTLELSEKKKAELDILVEIGKSWRRFRESLKWLSTHLRASKTCSIAWKSPVFESSERPITHSATKSELFSGVVTVQSSQVREPTSGAWIAGPNLTARGFAVSCGTTTSVLHGLAKGAKGLAGLGSSGLSLVSQFSASFQIPEIFVVYLSRSENGFIYFGNETYLVQTPLLVNPVYSQGASAATDSDYFIDVKSVEIDGEIVPINKELLSINKKNGVGGTKLSTIVPFTVMETSIYKAFTSIYIKRAKAMNFLRVASVVPFSVCFNASTMPTGVGAITFSIPKVDLVLPNKLRWQMTRPDNVLVHLPGNLVACLAFADGGAKPRTSIVIGGKQLLYTVLQFDIPRSRLGFSAGLQGFKSSHLSNKYTSEENDSEETEKENRGGGGIGRGKGHTISEGHFGDNVLENLIGTQDQDHCARKHDLYLLKRNKLALLANLKCQDNDTQCHHPRDELKSDSSREQHSIPFGDQSF
ncbi:basic 7S globulin-like [Papaver somniferum]|uniref:basic 7S globulin-like n=1 Tax=Papaver somniferum TaxID=3469 RepID=UPI000E6F62DC|nr:basic 7S globulin-like [Papaver somniferum]